MCERERESGGKIGKKSLTVNVFEYFFKKSLSVEDMYFQIRLEMPKNG